jgi:hypothetical protein
MIRVGDFSKFSRVAVKALRYYNEICGDVEVAAPKDATSQHL